MKKVKVGSIFIYGDELISLKLPTNKNIEKLLVNIYGFDIRPTDLCFFANGYKGFRVYFQTGPIYDDNKFIKYLLL